MSTEAQDQTDAKNTDFDAVNDSRTSSPDFTADDEALATAEQRIAELESELTTERDRLLRQIAELQNSLRRTERDREEDKKFNISKMAVDIVNVADNLRRALESVPNQEVADGQLKNLLEGVAATERELLTIFDKWKIQRLMPLGEAFDPHFHNAMMEISDSGQKPGTIVQVLIPGYKIFDRLLREAGVAVAKGEIKKVDTKA